MIRATQGFSAFVDGKEVTFQPGAEVPAAVAKDCNVIEKGLAERVKNAGRREED